MNVEIHLTTPEDYKDYQITTTSGILKIRLSHVSPKWLLLQLKHDQKHTMQIKDATNQALLVVKNGYLLQRYEKYTIEFDGIPVLFFNQLSPPVIITSGQNVEWNESEF